MASPGVINPQSENTNNANSSDEPNAEPAVEPPATYTYDTKLI